MYKGGEMEWVNFVPKGPFHLVDVIKMKSITDPLGPPISEKT